MLVEVAVSRVSMLAGLIAIALGLLVTPMALAQGGPIIIPRAPETIGRVPGAPAPPPITPEMTIMCRVAGIAAFQGRVHIRCSTGGCPPGTLCPAAETNPVDARIIYYATENTVSGSALAATALTVAGTALQTGRAMRLWYRSSASENPPGCLTHDCRRFVAVAID